MAKFAATDYRILINGKDWTSNIAQVELSFKYNDVDTTSFGQTGVSRTQGLIDGDVKIDFQQDYALTAGTSLDSFLYALTVATTLATVVVTPLGSATPVSSSNPSYTMTVRPLEYTPFSSSVGDLATISVTWPLSQGSVAPVIRATA